MTTTPPEPPPGGPEGESPAAAREQEPRCPRCGAAHDPLQEYCLECGQRLVPLPGATVTRETVWTRESPVWLWLALAALLAVALAAGAIVALAATDDENAGGTSVPTEGTSTLPVEPPTTTGVTLDTVTSPTITIQPPTTTGLTTTSATTGTTGTTGTTTTGTTTGTGGVISWPAGEDGFTVILRSVPTSQGRGQAESAAQQARNRGLPEVGILESSDFSSLNPGYYVTFTGIYDTQNEAENALPRARTAGFPTAYVREVAD
ncbi:MAG: hypothetical protein ACRDNI_00200 [Gaiellaceae bacterium]